MAERAAALLQALSAALASAAPAPGRQGAPLKLERLPDKGLAHDHVRLVGRGLLARVPKQSQMGLAAIANLAYQSACFERAAASGHAPRLHGRLAPAAAGSPLERGALLVEEIEGRPAALPEDLPALVEALAAIHRLPLPPAGARAPLQDEPDALASLAREIDGQAVHLDAAALAPGVRDAIERVRRRWQRVLVAPARPPRRLITFDAHPGNFLVTAAGRAVIVDLEKARYSHPPLDLAHATLYTSTTWDLHSRAELSPAQVIDACERWLRAMAEPGVAHDPWREWLVPLREAMWLWAVTWCAKWRVLSGQAARTVAAGEDWSAERSDAALVAHVRGRVDEYLSPRGTAFVIDECEALRAHFGAVTA
ncbi:MAG: aminoglycoside phosphotransferase family protein [Rubrivivax sp.]|nr:aminoglycoside phosphotransferase family protein [Rubrivivax sp.]